MRNQTIKKLALAAVLIAMDIVLARYLSIPLGYERLSLQFLPDEMAGILLGPVFGGLVTLGADLLGMFIQSGGLAINPLISVSALLRGVIPGLLLYRKELTFRRTLFAVSVSLLVTDILITSFALWKYFYSSIPLWEVMGVRTLVRVAYAPLQAWIITKVYSGIKKQI